MASNIQILALFKDKVMLEIEGKAHLLKMGESIDGIKLISADSKACILEIDGKQATYVLGSQIGTRFRSQEKPLVRVAQDERGLYFASGKINDKSVNFIIDTGATVVALNVNQAKALGLDYEEKSVQIETASGNAKAYHIILNKISLGPIVVYNVPAVVVEGNSPPDVLLGMTFLNRIEITDKNKLLELRQKY
ncbi:MAG: TIGR02281 family clan AA aspartic protease [Proteobacteria bacterium]|nr:TIGR02281 family clan AA aspartic protease [Pseudomonadota bacterium]